MNFLEYLASRFRNRVEKHDDYELGGYGQRSFGRILLELLFFPIRVLLIPLDALGNIFKRDERKRPSRITQRVSRSFRALGDLKNQDERKRPSRISQRVSRSFRALGNLKNQDERKAPSSFGRRVRRLGRALFLLPQKLLRDLTESYDVLSKRKDVKFLLAALLLIGFCVFAFILVINRGS